MPEVKNFRSCQADKEVRQEFYTFFEELEEVYEILSPDAFLRPFLPNYTELSEMYQIVRSNYERGVSLDKEFLRKTARLVQAISAKVSAVSR